MSHETVATEEHPYHPPYTKVFLALVALTVAEVLCAFLPPGAFLIVVAILVAIGVWKISLIGGYFMHLKFDQKLLSFVAMVPAFFGSILAIGLLMEYFRVGF